jgi:hypothetical protein
MMKITQKNYFGAKNTTKTSQARRNEQKEMKITPKSPSLKFQTLSTFISHFSNCFNSFAEIFEVKRDGRLGFSEIF